MAVSPITLRESPEFDILAAESALGGPLSQTLTRNVDPSRSFLENFLGIAPQASGAGGGGGDALNQRIEELSNRVNLLRKYQDMSAIDQYGRMDDPFGYPEDLEGAYKAVDEMTPGELRIREQRLIDQLGKKPTGISRLFDLATGAFPVAGSVKNLLGRFLGPSRQAQLADVAARLEANRMATGAYPIDPSPTAIDWNQPFRYDEIPGGPPQGVGPVSTSGLPPVENIATRYGGLPSTAGQAPPITGYGNDPSLVRTYGTARRGDVTVKDLPKPPTFPFTDKEIEAILEEAERKKKFKTEQQYDILNLRGGYPIGTSQQPLLSATQRSSPANLAYDPNVQSAAGEKFDQNIKTFGAGDLLGFLRGGVSTVAPTTIYDPTNYGVVPTQPATTTGATLVDDVANLINNAASGASYRDFANQAYRTQNLGPPSVHPADVDFNLF